MRVLLSVVGTRGDVQPVIAVAVELRKLGAEVRLAVPPNFVEWATAHALEARPVGVEMRPPRPGEPRAPVPSVGDLITDQFDAIHAAADGCDVLLGANAHQYAARSIAERHGIPYVSALYAPTSLPTEPTVRAWNERALDRVNENRSRFGLSPIDDVLRHIVTDRPWLATDPALDPPPSPGGLVVEQTGAWILTDDAPLEPELEAFLGAGEPPVYLGFGSMPAAPDAARTLVEATRATGRRAILSRGWAGLDVVDDANDCLAVGDVNQQKLFARVAAVVHHGGAGTTHTAARAGAPQVVVPMFSDQPYWASRVRALGVGASVPIAELSAERLTAALREVTDPSVVERARAFASVIGCEGAAHAARRLAELHEVRVSARTGSTR